MAVTMLPSLRGRGDCVRVRASSIQGHSWHPASDPGSLFFLGSFQQLQLASSRVPLEGSRSDSAISLG